MTKSSIFVEEDLLGAASLFPQGLLKKTIDLYQPSSVLDIGCGTGQSVAFFRDQGIDVVGVEGSELAISRARDSDVIIRHDLNEELDLGRRFDLVWSFEFVEHIHPKYLDRLLLSFTNHSDTLVFSAAHPGQGGIGHFNEQPPEYWIEHFERHGYELDRLGTSELRRVAETHSDNMLVLRRSNP